ncbi:MAG TPA: protein-L-isoaspartate(D-aspartate) O-methyltransferase [Chitinophagaceae bacterium]|nr:protein-L-isoaspartate(D-aspartate) O-methyltransferase [Chitinophagaceae bacterium]
MRNYEDGWRHKGMRSSLVEEIKEKGITDEKVLEAIKQVPRHFFMDTAFSDIAYEDRAFPIGQGQTISQPYTVAYQSQLLKIKPFDKVLEIGSGSGYQAAILSELGATVFTIERQKKLYQTLKSSFIKTKFPSIKFFYGDGFKGLPTYAPFNKVIITAAAPYIPEKLIAQLKPGGLMVVPVGGKERQKMYRITKKTDGESKKEIFDNFSFVPMLEGKQF